MSRTSTHAQVGAAGTDAATATMQAVVQDGYGDSSVLRLTEVPRPGIDDDEVLVRVGAAGLDRGTWHLMTGTPYLVRLALGLRAPRRPVVGRDLAGTVVEVGASVTRVRVGDEVVGIATGSFAEYAVVPERKVALTPVGVTYEEAAVLGISGMTALRAVADAGRVSAGQRVLVVGASGGVGSYAVQIAAALGAEVTAVCSAGKADLVQSLGAIHVLDYTSDDITAGPAYDAIIDIGGRTRVARLRGALTQRGSLVLVGGEGGGSLTGGMGRQILGALRSVVSRRRVVMLTPHESSESLERLVAMVDAGTVRPALDATYPLADAPVAMRRLERGDVRGKVAITVGEKG